MDIAEGSNHETNKLFDNTLSKSEELVETVSKEAPIKVNGDHNVAHMSFQPEPTCSSSNSSSPHNLVIDQPEDVNCNIGCDSVDHEKPPPRKKKRTLMPVKRKLKDNCDSRNPKKRHFADLAQNFISNSAPFISDDSTLNSNSNNVYCNNTLKPKRKYIPIKEVEQPKIFCEQSSELCNYNYVKPAVTYKCFKCGCDTFQTLLQLRCHQKVCLFKENHKHSSQDWNTTDNYNPSSNNVRGNTSGFLSNEDIHMRLEKQYIDTKTTAKAKKKVFLCAACKTYYENWNLFLHMREVHKRHICLYCVGMFPTAERLTLHLEMKHDLEQNHFESHEKLLRSSTNPCYIMCCTCEHIFTEHDDFQDHNCSEMSITCAFCGQKGRHTSNCKSLQREQVSNEKPKKKKRITKRKSRQSTAPESATNTNQSITDNSFIVGNSCSTLNNKTEISFNSSIKMNGFVDTGSAFGTGGEILNQPNPVEGNELVPLNLSSEKQFLKDPVISGGENPPVEGYSRIVPSLEGNSSEKRLNETEYSSGVGDNKQMDVSEANNRQETNTLSLKDQEVFSTVTQDEEAPKTHDAIISNDTSPDDPMSEHISELEKPNDNMSTSSTEGDGQQQDQQDESRDEETQPKIVPKFKIKIPKDYQAPVESDHSEEESEEEVDEGIEASGNGSEIMDDCPPPIKPDINIINSLQVNTNLLHNNPIDLSVLPENLFEDDKSSDVSDIVNLTNQRALEAAVQETINPVSTEEVTPPEEYLPAVELQLNRPLDKIPIVEFLRICLGYTHPICLYCNHARRIAVNGGNLAQHMITQHKFSATVDSITAEELQPPTIIIKLRNALDEIGSTYFNMETYCSMEKKLIRPFEKIFECFLCRFETRIHKELYLHNRKMHLRTAILCFMCRATFYTFSSILCHMCPGKQNYIQDVDIRFRCCFCEIDDIPSAFRLMVHLRKKHFACDVCLEDCQDQNRLSSHVWKHKLHHFCYRCGIGYRNKPDITKHLFWKHGTESVLCKRCLQKRWPHIYHFCIPPASFVCEVCNLAFSKAMYLKVHKRLHNGENPYTCTEENCDKQFISKKLLTKHLHEHKEPEPIQVEEENKSAEVKDKVKWDEEKKEQGVEGQVNVDIDSFKKKRRKVKKEEDNIADLMDLPVPNLSESDSSDEFDSEKIKQDNFNLPVAKVMLSSPSDAGDDDKLEDTTPMMDIWENFKSFQASRTKQKEEDLDEETEEMQHPPILHVSQSDHDYCMMYKPISKEDDMLDNIEESKKLEDITKTFNETSPSKKKQKSPRKSQRRSVSSSSRSSSSSGSSSSTCRSNCSCCSASGSGSGSSSSSDDSDSSTSEGRRRIAAKKKAKAQKRIRNKSGNSSKNNNSDVVDVVNPDPKFPDTINFNSIILETDLETDESDTDEDFYDENPQKLALQHLEEKRKLLIEQTCLSPLRSYASIDNTEVPTPSCSEEAPQEKKVKIKKKKRDKRTPKNSAIPTFKLNIPAIANIVETLAPESPKETSMIRSANVSLQQPIGNITEPEISTPMLPHLATVLQSRSSTPIPAPVTPKNRLSTGSSSDADATLKRSKRARRPNKFYGYTSDDDSTRPLLTGPAAFKPTPPPNLTWRKEDLPTPPRSQTLKIKSSGNSLKKGTPTNTPPLPPIPPIIIRPSTIIPTKAPVIDQQRPPIVEPMRVPPVPVHHIQLPQQHGSSRRESMESDSSDEDRLHIPYPVQYNTQRQENANSALLKTIPAISTLPPPAPVQTIPPALLPNPDLARIQYFQRNNIRWPIRPPIGARPPREGESVYCYCRCPYDEVSEMIACDGDDCMIEWFHFECVGILVPPKGKWFCPECRPRYSQDSMNYQNT